MKALLALALVASLAAPCFAQKQFPSPLQAPAQAPPSKLTLSDVTPQPTYGVPLPTLAPAPLTQRITVPTTTFAQTTVPVTTLVPQTTLQTVTVPQTTLQTVEVPLTVGTAQVAGRCGCRGLHPFRPRSVTRTTTVIRT
jgi:hypothetical protein